ncbi:LysR family transcriptional regulator, partial [Pseudomonas aeruginosa]
MAISELKLPAGVGLQVWGSAAEQARGQTRAVVSFNLKRLEAELGVSLLSRSTRRMALTDAGERFYQR